MTAVQQGQEGLRSWEPESEAWWEQDGLGPLHRALATVRLLDRFTAGGDLRPPHEDAEAILYAIGGLRRDLETAVPRLLAALDHRGRARS